MLQITQAFYSLLYIEKLQNCREKYILEYEEWWDEVQVWRTIQAYYRSPKTYTHVSISIFRCFYPHFLFKGYLGYLLCKQTTVIYYYTECNDVHMYVCIAAYLHYNLPNSQKKFHMPCEYVSVSCFNFSDYFQCSILYWFMRFILSTCLWEFYFLNLWI